MIEKIKRWLKKELWLLTPFPEIPESNSMRDSLKKIISDSSIKNSSDSISLKFGRFITEEDVEEMCKRFVFHDFNDLLYDDVKHNEKKLVYYNYTKGDLKSYV